nr:hypothetical protein [Tanacetum cinerariifolium]
MVIDKSEICLGRREKAFFTDLTKFVEHCKLLVKSSENVKCPCKSCRNVSWVSIPELPRHITNNGWDPSYKTWTNHDEPNDLPPVIHNITQPQMRSNMTTCLNDLSCIPPNHEQNEPTQGDISDTSNKPTQAIRSLFEELYASANKELCSGCDYVTRLDFMAKFTYFKVKDYKDKQFCPICNTSRWKDSNTPRKKVPKKAKIDDLKDLWVKPGVKTIDVATGQKFNMRAMVLCTINDFPARSSLSGWSGQGYKACPTCNEDTPFTRVCQHMSQGVTEVTLAVMIVSLHMSQQEVAEVVAREPESQIWEAGKPAECIPTRKPRTSDREGVPDALWFLAQHLAGVEGRVLEKIGAKSTVVRRQGSRKLDALRDMQAKSTVVRRQGSRKLDALRDMQTFFDTHTVGDVFLRDEDRRLYTFFDTHTVGDVFLQDEDRRLYEEMVRLHGLGTYTNDQIIAMVHWGKQRGHILGVDRVLARRGKDVLDVLVPRCNHTFDVDDLKRSNKQLQK